MNTQKQKKIKKDVARLLSILLVVVSLSFPQKYIYASYLGESLSVENENLTEYEISRIKEIAKDNKIEIVENKPLARMIYHNVDLGAEIPPELYQAVAEVLAYVYRLKNPEG